MGGGGGGGLERAMVGERGHVPQRWDTLEGRDEVERGCDDVDEALLVRGRDAQGT